LSDEAQTRLFPIFLNLKGRPCVVVGGGEVAARKAASLLRAGARVRLVAPELSEAARALLVSPQLEHISREYRRGDVSENVLAFAATDDPQVNATVCDEAEESGVPVNVADDPVHCTFFMPATIYRDPIAIAISTLGASPALARLMRERIEEMVPPSYAHLARLLGRLRPEFAAAVPSPAERKQRVQRVLESEVPALLWQGQFVRAEQMVRRILGLAE